MSSILKEALIDLKEEIEEGSLEDFGDYAEAKLPHQARAKYFSMNPRESELTWVCQEECNENDLETLLKAFGEYYKDETAGKTYTVVMKSRSYPDNYIKRTVSFTNGEFNIEEEGPEVLMNGDIQLYHYVDNDGKYGDKGEHYFQLYNPEEDITAVGKTIGEVKENFVEELDKLNGFVDLEPGYKVAYNKVNLDYKDNNYSIDEYVKEVEKGKSPEDLVDYYDDLESVDNMIAVGEYETYEELI